MIKHFFGWLLRTLFGWRYEGNIPKEACVCLAVPHTSNWDGIWLMALSDQPRLKLSWMIKVSAIRWPWAWLLNRLGAVPIDRSKRENTVQKMIAAFKEDPNLLLVIPPSGTRRKTDTWRSGFYHIALGADVPVALCFLDYKRKRGGFGPIFKLTGNVTEDMNRIRSFYEEKAPQARYPEQVTTIRIKEEALATENPTPTESA